MRRQLGGCGYGPDQGMTGPEHNVLRLAAIVGSLRQGDCCYW